MLRSILVGSVLIVFVAGVYTFWQPAQVPDASIYDTPLTQAELIFERDVKPVMDSRCVVCHACYDAPCQLKLGSFSGVARGASKDPVYKGDRLLAADPSRLFIDAHSVSEWRKRDFFAVLNEEQSPAQNLNNSLVVKMLEQKRQHPLAERKQLGKEFDLDINREWQCPTLEEHADYQKEYPKWGMPYGLPQLNQDEHTTITQWIEQGAATAPMPAVPLYEKQQILQWEKFLNGDSLKHQLMARYMYEHFFIAHLYFATDSSNNLPIFFRLFRSKTPPGEPIDIIATRRPFSDPGVKRVYYRFAPVKETLVDKTHMPFRLDSQRLLQYQQWFIDADYEVTQLPGYAAESASNPFVTFEQIPINARYRFMLSEAQYTIMQFIKGPVCRGQIALNVINDHFWVFFAEPSLSILEHEAEFLSRAREKIELPAAADSNALPTNWIAYAEQEKEYIEARSEYINQTINQTLPLDLSLIWDGEGSNDNVALTVFRHFDAATVVKGLVGERPQTAWVITYPLFERIHYLLVAGYDVYGNVGHQLNSRMYMDFLRMEGEFNFLSLLPKASRQATWEQWYRGIVSPVEEYVASANVLAGETQLDYETEQPLNELLQMLSQHVAAAVNSEHAITNGFNQSAVQEALRRLNGQVGRHASLLPQASFVRIHDNSSRQHHFYSLLRNNAYSNISHIFAEQARRIPAEDSITVGYGFLSSHPNAFFDVNINEVNDFVAAVETLKTEQDLELLFDRFGVRRTAKQFWSYADGLHGYYQENYPIRFGYFDFNRLEDH
ncbi:fatty acid cis/trans isomerase [Alteromonas flava]|uniref:fatty acid cis/trans isomerase n=1 Tax=Alteromonas flava TaxID=2048003 RepID=UPI000C28438B|nr:fatty acid cis/trans isomerase [Alteromonas flava]